MRTIYFWIIFVVSFIVYGITHTVLNSYIKMNIIENELSVILEEVLSNKKSESCDPIADRISLNKKFDKPSFSMVSQLKTMKNIIETLRNEIDQLRDGSYQHANFALETTGAEIISIFNTKTEVKDFISCLMSAIFKNGCDFSKSPRNLIKGKPNPGECWIFKDFPGKVLIKLSAPAYIDSIGIQHIWDHESINGVSDAPKEFKVYASNDDLGQALVHIGTFVYEIHSNRSLQVFKLKRKTALSYIYAYFEFLSNHGHTEQTCVYRVRVHGQIDTYKFEKINESK